MRTALLAIRDRLDRAGIILSGLCVVHCILGVLLVGVLGIGGDALLSPEFHRVGLALALVVGIVSLGFGMRRHGSVAPLAIGASGLTLMGTALLVNHGIEETVLTVAGVALVAFAHIRNLHRAC